MADSRRDLEKMQSELLSRTPLSTAGGIASKRQNETVAEYTKRLYDTIQAYNQYILKLEQANKLNDKQLKLTGVQTRNLDALNRKYLDLVKSQSTLGKAMSYLSTKMGGGSGVTGAATRFGQAIPGIISTVDEASGMMKILGMNTEITAGAFASWAAIIPVVIGAAAAFLEFQDTAQKRQGELIKAFGSVSSVSIAAPYRAAAAGLEIAGTSGQEAAEKMLTSLYKMRGVRGSEIKNAFNLETDGGEAAFQDLVALTAGFSDKVPAWMEALRHTFGMNNGMKMLNVIKRLGTMTHASTADMEDLAASVINLAESFVTVGINVDDATKIMSNFADAIGSQGLAKPIALNYAQTSLQQFTTGAGVDKMMIAAIYAGKEFEKLPKRLQTDLNAQAVKQFGEGSDFRNLKMLERLRVLEQDKSGDLYSRARLGVLYFLRDIEQRYGRPMAKKGSPILTGQEYVGIEPIISAAEAAENAPGAKKSAKEAMDKYYKGESGNKQAAEIFQSTVSDFQKNYIAAARAQQEWYSDTLSMWEGIKAWFAAHFIMNTAAGTELATTQTQNEINSNMMSNFLAGKQSNTLTPSDFTTIEQAIVAERNFKLNNLKIKLQQSQSQQDPVSGMVLNFLDEAESKKYRKYLRDIAYSTQVQIDDLQSSIYHTTRDVGKYRWYFDISATNELLNVQSKPINNIGNSQTQSVGPNQ